MARSCLCAKGNTFMAITSLQASELMAWALRKQNVLNMKRRDSLKTWKQKVILCRLALGFSFFFFFLHNLAAFGKERRLHIIFEQLFFIKIVGRSQKPHENLTASAFLPPLSHSFLQTLKSEQTDMIIIVRNVKIKLELLVKNLK